MTPKPINEKKKTIKDRKRKNLESIENATNDKQNIDRVDVANERIDVVDDVDMSNTKTNLSSTLSDDDDNDESMIDDVSLLLPTRFAHMCTIESAINERLSILVEVSINYIHIFSNVF